MSIQRVNNNDCNSTESSKATHWIRTSTYALVAALALIMSLVSFAQPNIMTRLVLEPDEIERDLNSMETVRSVGWPTTYLYTTTPPECILSFYETEEFSYWDYLLFAKERNVEWFSPSRLALKIALSLTFALGFAIGCGYVLMLSWGKLRFQLSLLFAVVGIVSTYLAFGLDPVERFSPEMLEYNELPMIRFASVVATWLVAMSWIAAIPKWIAARST